MKSQFSFRLSTYLLVTLLPLTTYAQSENGVAWGIGIAATSDDNVLRAEDSLAHSDSYVSLLPSLSAKGLYGNHEFNFNYEGRFNQFDKNDSLNFSEHRTSLLANLDHGNRIKTSFLFSYDGVAEDPGSNNALAQPSSEFTLLQTQTIQASLYYGAFESTGQLVFTLGHKNKSHNNNAQEFRDHKQNNLTSTFFYRVAPKSRLLLEASFLDINYENTAQFIDQSSKDIKLLTGFEWQISGKTTSVVKLGYLTKKYDTDAFDDISGLTYLLDVYWKPATYSTLKIGGARQAIESAINNGSAYLSTSVSAQYDHAFTERTKMSSGFVYYIDDVNEQRDDKRSSVNLSVTHSLRDWLSIALGYQLNSRSSNLEQYSYDANLLSLSMTAYFD